MSTSIVNKNKCSRARKGGIFLITSQEIARLAGVSRGTVDRVLNNRTGVKPETRERVQLIASKLGYVPNRAGKALSSVGHPIHIGVILNSLHNDFYDEVVRGLNEARIAYSDFNISLTYRYLAGYDVTLQLQAIRELRLLKVQAMIITPIDDPLIAAEINALAKENIPVIALNNDIQDTKRLLYVGCDYIASGRTAAGLIGLLCGGKGTVLVVGGSLHMLGHNQRIEGFSRTLKEKYPAMKLLQPLEGCDDDIRVYHQVCECISSYPHISALYFAASGSRGGIQAVEKCFSKKMPVIIVCDDVPYTKQCILEGKIQATVCQQPYRQGFEAAKQMIEYLITGRRPAQNCFYTENKIKIAENIEDA